MAQANDDGFGAVLRRLRRSRNLTQEELAERAQISAKAVSALERGERRRPTRTPSERWPARSSSTPPSAPDSAHRFPTRRRPPRRAPGGGPSARRRPNSSVVTPTSNASRRFYPTGGDWSPSPDLEASACRPRRDQGRHPSPGRGTHAARTRLM
ncbi:hypothetical protein ACN94_05580 [Gordonia paraffinivorans]|uniref:helix-turn-helix domain-containing protein n=1 Tax=Gordonia paraffinivorans TaxID=175628 RepID=UPI0009FDC688|nr:helix-turn-helix domain-containing protein [Gordonia paraffinivorans]MBY4573064.1 hypothetical protein [Gordonia paraffinivorans]